MYYHDYHRGQLFSRLYIHILPHYKYYFITVHIQRVEIVHVNIQSLFKKIDQITLLYKEVDFFIMYRNMVK